ncbi:stalk domain-containing protein [Paenibacillus alkalitolerans]|uniref:stalk domain-containing protein n=1 Tax=Paenibacillus alkalitolerans TaxID=2799335 RepID=UPI0018F5698D|nr:stalk domain-containing protein [Paenibacillus alkalitolerans]
MKGRTMVQLIAFHDRTYVPLRFISETLGGRVAYNAMKKRAVIRTPSGQQDYETLMSGDLTKAREIVTGLLFVYENGVERLPLTGEGFTTKLTFPKGEALRVKQDYKGMTWYAEVDSDGLLVVRWQKDNLGEKRETGTTPEPFGEAVYFTDSFIVNSLAYGTINEDRVETQLGLINRDDNQEYKGVIVIPIEGEVRTDAR